MSNDPVLIRVELAFRSTQEQSVQELGDRIHEAVSMIVGRPALEEFRVRTLPLTQRKGPRAVE
jgi:hypothetical protein